MQDFKWCPLHLDRAKPTRIWASQELNLFPPSKHDKYVAHYSFHGKHYTHIVDLHSNVDHFEHSASLLSGSWLLHWLFDISEDKWTELEHHQSKLTKQNKYLQDFPPCCFVYTHYATLFYEAPSFKNEEEWGRCNTEAMTRKTERNGNIMKW